MTFIHYRTEGIILKKENRGENDQLFTIYTKDFGKLEILGRAIRKISSKLRADVELFYISEIEFIQGKAYKTLTDAIAIGKLLNLRKDLERLGLAQAISDLLNDFLKGEERDERIWELLNEVFQKLDDLKFKISVPKLIYYYFLWNFLSLSGYGPELYSCSLCQKKLVPEELYFNQRVGGIICQDCFKKTSSGEKIDLETIKLLRIFLEKDWDVLSKLKVDNKYLKNLESFSEKYLSFVSGSIK